MNDYPLTRPRDDGDSCGARAENALKVCPVQFKMSCAIANMEKCVRQLHCLAADCDFISLSDVIVLTGDDCSILRDNDVLIDLKTRAIHILKTSPQRPIHIEPEKIVAFCGILPNGEHFYIGLAVYPEIVTLESGDILTTGLTGRSSWQGFVQTIRTHQCADAPDDCPCPVSFNCPSSCARSHLLTIQILDQAKAMGILQEVFDPAMYWELRDEERLFRAIRRSKQSVLIDPH